MRPAIALVVAVILAGCSGGGGGEREQLRSKPRLYGIGEVGAAGKRLIPYTTLAGYLNHSKMGGGGTFRLITGIDQDRPLFDRPTAVSANAHGVFVIDQYNGALHRFRWQIPDPEHATPEHLAGAHGGLGHPDIKRISRLSTLREPIDLFVSSAGGIFVADGEGKKVVQLDEDGGIVQEFKEEEHLNKPVAVTLDARGLRVFIADGLFDHIIVFNNEGKPLYRIGQRGEADEGFRNIRDMVQGRDNLLYVLDGIHRQISVYGLDGSFFGNFGRETFTDPGGIAIDDEGRVYVADRFNHRIIIFRNRQVVETFGDQGPDPGQFYQPAGLAYFDGRLYVADRDNARVQVFRVVPEAIVRGGGENKP